MGFRRKAAACVLLLWAVAALPLAAAAAPAPEVTARTDRNPDPGGNFTLTFTLDSHQTANYTIQVSPRPEFAFMDLSNGTRTRLVQNGTAADINFEMRVSGSARQGTYAVSYTVMRESATVKMGTVDVQVGPAGFCQSYLILLSVPLLAVGLALGRRPGQ